MKRFAMALLAVVLLVVPASAQQAVGQYPDAPNGREAGFLILVETEDGSANYAISIEALLSGLVAFPGPAIQYWGRFAETEAALTDDYVMNGGTATSVTTETATSIVLPRVSFTPQTVWVGLLVPSSWLPLDRGYPRQQFGLPGPPWTVARTTTIGNREYTLLTDQTNRLLADAVTDASRTYLVRP